MPKKSSWVLWCRLTRAAPASGFCRFDNTDGDGRRNESKTKGARINRLSARGTKRGGNRVRRPRPQHLMSSLHRRFPSFLQLCVESRPFLPQEFWQNEVKIEHPFNRIQKPFSFAGFDSNNLTCVRALDWMCS